MGKDLYGKELGPGFGQRKSGQYYARFENRFGVRQTLYSVDLQELRDKYNTAVYENKKKMNVVDEGTTLDEFFDIWINEYKYKIICEDTKQGYKLVYKKHISPTLGKRTLTEVTSLMVRITSRCEAALKRQLKQREIILNKHSARPLKEFENLLFLSAVGTPLNATTYSDAIGRVVDTINTMKDPLEQMEKFSGHCFRHTFATRCFEANIQPKTVQAYLGHATLQMTMDLYTL